MAAPVDYAALAEQARRSAPVDYAALADQARNTSQPQGPGPWASGYVPVDNGPAPQPYTAHHTGNLRGMTGRDSRDKETSIPGQIADLMEGTAKYSSGAALPALMAAPAATIGGAIAGAVGQQAAQYGASAMGASPDTARLAGDVAAVPAAMLGGRTANAAVGAVAKARTPNPDLMMGKALNPHPADTEFKKYIPTVRENIQRGAEITQTPVTDVDSALAATEASMKEHMDALEPHKENARRVQAKMPTSVIKAAQIAAIPKGLELRDPEAYNSAVHEINAQFPGKHYLNTDEVFDQAILNNNQLSAFHSGKADAQSTKLITNSGDTAVLKAAGDAYRQWITENLGPIAKDINENWGNLNGVKHYLQNKVNPSFLQQPATPLAGVLESTGVHPGASIKHGLVQGIAGRVAGVPTGIDPMLESAFANTPAAEPPWTPNLVPHQLAAPADTSGSIGYNPATVVDSPYAPKALPPATTHFQGPVPDQSGPIAPTVPAPAFRVGFPADIKQLPPASMQPVDTEIGSQHGDIVGPTQPPQGVTPARQGDVPGTIPSRGPARTSLEKADDSSIARRLGQHIRRQLTPALESEELVDAANA